MSVTNDDLDNFHQFALNARQQDTGATIEQLLAQWRSLNKQVDINDAIREGLREIKAGGGKPMDEFLNEMDAKYNLSADA